MIRTTRLAVAAAVIGCAAGSFGIIGTVVAQAQDVPAVPNCEGQPLVRPDQLTVACGDGGLFLKQIQWTSWQPDRAAGTGVVWENTCQPACAAGNYTHGQGTIVLSDYDPAHNEFGKATVTDSNGQVSTWPLVAQQH